jgi:hypothetical protein
MPTEPPGVNAKLGERLHMDYGFWHGSNWKKDSDGKTVTSIDGYWSCLIIIDRATCYIWILSQRQNNLQCHKFKDFYSDLKDYIGMQQSENYQRCRLYFTYNWDTLKCTKWHGQKA